ncbi:response regulator [Pelosinus sp. sgz500959]|uniref:response regulator n=1 Tax=Pelosinus sp. sgz500959 TaxID=3242472 RepID=UPI0036704CF5
MAELTTKERDFSTVLFVDDELNILSSIRRAVIDEDYTAYFANSGAEALKIMEKNEISVIVTDMKMPGMDGLQLLKIVKEKYPKTVKIVLSGYTQLSQVLATVNQADIFNFIAKPWDMESELKYVINRAIEHYQLKKNEIQLQINLEKRNTAYQNVLKKMEASSMLRAKQIQHIKKISSLLLESIEMKKENETQYLANFLRDYTERVPGEMEYLSLGNIVEKLRQLVADDPRYSQGKVQVTEAATGTIQGNYDIIQFPVLCLLKLLSQNHDIQNLYIYITTQEDDKKVRLTFSLFFLDETGRYQSELSQCSYQLAEEVFREIMNVKFITGRKNERQVIQLEFSLEKT